MSTDVGARRLPLFPLPVVLFPSVVMPLHIFEKRYRQLVAHCLESDKRFGLVYHDPDRHGPFHVDAGRIGCMAEIVEFEPIPDGRSLIVVRGGPRFRLRDGIESDSLYYEGLVEPVPDQDEDPGESEREGRRVDELFRAVLNRVTDEEEGIPPLEPGAPVSYQLARWIKIDPNWQQALLENRSELDRLGQIRTLLESVD